MRWIAGECTDVDEWGPPVCVSNWQPRSMKTGMRPAIRISLLEPESRTNSLGPDGSVWFIEPCANLIGRLKDESFEEYEVPGDNPMLSGPAVASDGVVWFAILHSGSLARLADGRVDIFGLP